ncbi:MAG: DUF308 domain-containing protein [Clostridia bacterium]|nr:DUF308 domain-containing protein [Clostridia bacterium]
MKRVTKLVCALLTIALGALFVIYKTEVLSVCMTVLGVGLIVLSVLDLIRLKLFTSAIEGIIGIAVLVIGWLLVDIALFVIAIVLALYGGVELLRRIFERKKKKKGLVLLIGFIEPFVCIAAAAFLLMNSGAALSSVMVVVGIILIVDGLLSLIVALAGKKKKKKSR